MFLTLALVASVSKLCDGSPTFIDAVDWRAGGMELAEMISNITTYPSSSEDHIAMETKCSFLERVAEATRRRRHLHHAARTCRNRFKFQHTAEPAEVETLAPDSQFRTSAVSGVGMSFLAGLSTTIGAGLVFLLPGFQASASQMSFVLALAAGVMLSATVFEFWLPALASSSISTAISASSFSMIGAASFLLLSKFVPELDFVEADVEIQGGNQDEKAGQAWHLARMLLLSLTLHNFPEGFAVAVSSLGSDSAGFVVMLAIAMHNVPEGIAIAVPVFAATGSRKKALWWTFLSGMAEPAGAILALFLVKAIGVVIPMGIENLLCAVGGVMCAVAVKELLPSAWKYGKPFPFVSGLLSGFFLMLATILMGA